MTFPMNTDAKYTTIQRDGMVDSIIETLGNLTMHGRARRSEFWWFFLSYYLYKILDKLVDPFLPIGLSFVGSLFGLYLALHLFFVTVRRLHDIGRNATWAVWGWTLINLSGYLPKIYPAVPENLYYLFFDISFCMFLYLLRLCAKDSDKGTNVYGASPKYKEINNNDI